VKIREIYDNALKNFNIYQPDLLILLCNAFGISKEYFWTYGRSKEAGKDESDLFINYTKRLVNNEPIPYIIGKKEFYSESFFVNKDVLIPRPETELLVDKLLEISDNSTNILDIGTGSGIISILVAKKKGSNVISVDLNKNAIKVLKKNIKYHKVKHLVTPLRSDLFPKDKMLFDIIVSNPPYISEKDMVSLESTILDYEPEIALLGGKSGYEIIEKIIKLSPTYLKKNGVIILEFGYDQKETVNKMLQKHGYKNIKFFNDLNKIPRIVKANL